MRIFKWSLLFSLISITVLAQKAPEKKSGWSLGAHAYTFRLFTLTDALKKIDSCGLKNVELLRGQKIGGDFEGTVDVGMSPEQRKELKKLLKSYGVTPTAMGVVNAKDEASWIQLFEFAKDMGLQVLNTEPAPDQFKYLIPLAEKYKIKLGLHNHPKPSRYWHPDSVLKYAGNSPFVGACVDIGHYVRSGLDPVASMKKLDGKILAFHFKDVVKDSPDAKYHDVIWGNGDSKVDEVIAEMKRQKFKGPISVEYEYNWEHSAPEVAQSVAYFREAYRRIK